MPIVLYPTSTSQGAGDPSGPVEGTGLAVPAGVEGVYNFNGLTLNYRDWWDTFIITKIDGLDDADVRYAAETNPNRHGETPFDNYYGSRTITLSGRIRCFSLKKLRDMEQAFRSAFGDLQEHPLTIAAGSVGGDVQIVCKKYQKINIEEAQGDFRFFRDFQVTLRASDPFFYSTTELFNQANLSTSGPTTVSTFNSGNFVALPRFRLIGPMTDPEIINLTNNTKIKLNGTVPSGDVWDIDGLAKTIVDGDGFNHFKAYDINNEWVLFEPGYNQIQITASSVTNGTSQVQTFWRDTWV